MPWIFTIIVAVDDRAAKSLVDKAKEANVPAIGYDITIPNAEVAYFLTRNNREVGKLQVEGALKFAPPNADHPPNYVLIKGDPDNNVARELSDVYNEMLKPLVKRSGHHVVIHQPQTGRSDGN